MYLCHPQSGKICSHRALDKKGKKGTNLNLYKKNKMDKAKIIQPLDEQNIKKQEKSLLREIHSVEGSLADRVTGFSGSIYFVYFHIIWFSLWIVVNQGLLEPLIPVFDPFPYGLLTMLVSLEAIFLSTFILIAQNRQELVEEYRELEEEKEDQEQEEEVEDIQKDLDQIKAAIKLISDKVIQMEKHNNPANKPRTDK